MLHEYFCKWRKISRSQRRFAIQRSRIGHIVEAVFYRPARSFGISGNSRSISRRRATFLASIYGAADVALPPRAIHAEVHLVPLSLLPRRPLASQLCVMLAVPTLGKRGCGRTLGGIRVLVRLLVVPSPYHREVGHLERVGLLAAAFQRACHTVTHVEVARRDVRRQVQL